MINSLQKDSHITRGCPIPKITLPPRQSVGASKREEYRNAPENNSTGISVNKPAEINFCGLASRTLANDAEFKTLVEAAKEIVGKGKKEFKKVIDLMRDVADSLIPQVQKEGEKPKSPKEVSETVKKFIEANKVVLQKKIDLATELTKEDNIVWIKKNRDNRDCKEKIPKMIDDPTNPSKKVIEYRANPEELREEILKSITDATDGTSVADKKPWYKGNKYLNYFLCLAEKNNVAFSATFALILTGIFRPAAIVALPSNKKNKDDQKYAAAHSIASGIIGFIVATVVSNPVADGLKKVLEEPSEYLKAKNEKYYQTNELFKAARKTADERARYLEASMKINKAANMWVTRGIDILMAIPKAFITIALIPPILKYVFGWEKKKHANTPINIQTNYNQNNNINKPKRSIDGGIK